MKKTLISIVTGILLLCSLTINAFALEEPDRTRSGSVSIAMTFEGTPVPGGSLTLYRVADVHEENGADYSFVYVAQYAQCTLSLEQLEDSTVAQGLADYTREKNIAGTKKTIDKQGLISFTDLELGLYLLVQEEAASGYNKLNPFLVSVPVMQDGSYIYDVDATPKLALEKDPNPPTPPPPDIPKTGLNQWPVPVLCVSGLILVVFGWYLCASGRKKQHET